MCGAMPCWSLRVQAKQHCEMHVQSLHEGGAMWRTQRAVQMYQKVQQGKVEQLLSITVFAIVHITIALSKYHMQICRIYFIYEMFYFQKRTCHRHKCLSLCCVSDFHPCPNECRRTLNCGVHKCDRLCHPGNCPPCSVLSK